MDAQTELGKLNGRILAPGESFPEVLMADGTRAQTGTVAAMLVNIERYDKGETSALEDLKAALPTLVKVGLFKLFTPAEWRQGQSPGRRILGQLEAEYLKEPT